MLLWISLVRCSSRSTVIFLIVSREIQKYDQRKFYFFSEKKNFQICYSRSSLKKNRKKNLQFFSVHQNCKTKKFAISKISNKKFRKHQIQKMFAKILWKNLRRNIFVKKNIFTKKNSINKMLTKKKFVEKNFRKKNFLNNFGNFFIFEQKFGWNSVNFRKKNRKKFWK